VFYLLWLQRVEPSAEVVFCERERERERDSFFIMGNASFCGAKGDEPFVTVLRGNGAVLTFFSPMRVADLLQEYSGHFVCHSSSLLLMHEVKLLPPHTILTPWETYFLLPFPASRKSNCDDLGSASSSSPCRADDPQQQLQGTGTMKFVISNELFAKILTGSIAEEVDMSKSTGRSAEKTPLLLEMLKSSSIGEAVTAE